MTNEQLSTMFLQNGQIIVGLCNESESLRFWGVVQSSLCWLPILCIIRTYCNYRIWDGLFSEELNLFIFTGPQYKVPKNFHMKDIGKF